MVLMNTQTQSGQEALTLELQKTGNPPVSPVSA